MKNIKILSFSAFVFVLILFIGYEVRKEIEKKGCYLLEEDVSYQLPPLSNPEEINLIFTADTGYPGEIQTQTANSIKAVCEKLGCDFGILAGDNIYEDGVSNVDDKQFEEKYEKAFGSIGIPFFLNLGNHDVKGNPLAQVKYTEKSKTWIMPNFFYSFRYPHAEFIVSNSNCSFLTFSKISDWVSGLKPSRWNFLITHHPVYGLLSHGDGDPVYRWAWGTWAREKIDILLSGHNHSLSHLQKQDDSTEYIVSGAGSKNVLGQKDISSEANTLFYDKGSGFAHIKITKRNMTLRFFNEKGLEIYFYQKAKSI